MKGKWVADSQNQRCYIDRIFSEEEFHRLLYMAKIVIKTSEHYLSSICLSSSSSSIIIIIIYHLSHLATHLAIYPTI